jgi:DNA-binding NarL/FixJ family response regulator
MKNYITIIHSAVNDDARLCGPVVKNPNQRLQFHNLRDNAWQARGNSRLQRCEETLSIMDPTRIVVVDDHPFVREGLKQLLAGQADFILAGEAANTNDAQHTIDETTPDIAVVDLALGTDDGVELIRWIRQHHPEIRVLVLSMQEEALYAERLLRLGVNGYIMKNVASTDFLGALRKVARGQRHLSNAMGERLLSQVARGRGAGGQEDPVTGLTGRELEVFRLIGEGVSTREISERLKLSMKTVDAHRRHMREKLNLRSTSELIRYATQWVSGGQAN